MSSPIVFMDTETTGLSLDDDIWEFAAVRRETDGTENELHLFIDHAREKCARLPESFREDHYDRYLNHRAVTPSRAISLIRDLFVGPPKPHVVGAVPNFDSERIAAMCARLERSQPNWHHHLIDVETLVVGYLARQRRSVPLPWDSNELSRAVGVDPDEFARHTAIGDVRWVMAQYDAVMGLTAEAVES